VLKTQLCVTRPQCVKIHKKSLSPFCIFKDEVRMVKHCPPHFLFTVDSMGKYTETPSFAHLSCSLGLGILQDATMDLSKQMCNS